MSTLNPKIRIRLTTIPSKQVVTQIKTIKKLTRLPVTSKRCLIGNLTAINLSIVMTRRFFNENRADIMNTTMKASSFSQSWSPRIKSSILKIATAIPTRTSDNARLSNSFSKVLRCFLRKMNTTSALFIDIINSPAKMNTSSST